MISIGRVLVGMSTYPKRLAAEMDGEFVVYINGMRLNKLRAIHKYIIAGRKLAAMEVSPMIFTCRHGSG